MKNKTPKKLREAIENAENFILQMEQMEDKKLSKHIELFRQQMQIAYNQKNHSAYNLLAEYEMQTIIARANKKTSKS